MNKNKIYRAIALVGALALIVLVLVTFMVAIIDFEGKDDMLKTLIVCDFVIPGLLYGYSLIYKAAKGRDQLANKIKDQILGEEEIKEDEE